MKCDNETCEWYNEKYVHNCSNLNLNGRTSDCLGFRMFKNKKELSYNSAANPEPAPIGDGQTVISAVTQDFIDRAEVGQNKYGTYLRIKNGRNALMDAYQEAIDLCMYLKQALMEQESKQGE